MWRSGRLVRHGWKLGIAALAVASGPPAGFTEQPLTQLPEDVVSFSFAWAALPQAVVEVTKDYGPLAGVSWGVLKGSSEAVGRVVNLMDQAPSGQHVLAHGGEARSPAWLNLRGRASRQARHEPALLRYTF